MKSNLPALGAGLAAASIWGGMYVVSKVVLDVIPPFALLSLRLCLGFLVLAVVVVLGGGFRSTHRQALSAVAVGFVGYGISLGFQFVGTKLSTASNGALVTSATPVLVFLFAKIILGEHLGARKILAVTIACLGVLAVIAPWSAATADSASISPASASMILGNLSLLGAALTWALYSVLVRLISKGGALLESTALMFLGGLPTSLIFGAIEIAAKPLGTISLALIVGILYLGIVSTAGAMYLWNYAFSKLPAASASLTFFAQPVVGTLLGWALLGETIKPLFLAGGALIGIGIYLAASRSALAK
ncbi:DMT family transporter [Treponema sp.]